MMMPTWPNDTMAAKVAFYGDPRGPHGVNESWFSNNVIRVVPPWKMLYAGKPIKSMAFHSKCAAALGAALTEIWETCGKDQKTVEKNGLQEFGGTFNYRLIRSSAAISHHAYANANALATAGEARV